MTEDVQGPSREDSLLAFASRMMWVAERSMEVAGNSSGEITAGIAGMAVSCGIVEKDFLAICIDRMKFDEIMRKEAGLDGPVLSREVEGDDG